VPGCLVATSTQGQKKKKALGRRIHFAQRVEMSLPGIKNIQRAVCAIGYELGRRYAALSGKAVGGFAEELVARNKAIQFLDFPEE